jgi:2-C-methyl-D-erythritol 4-phosphate cytidylyltransferase
MSNTHILIVAGGSGSRMGIEMPKQFLELNNKPILLHTLERFFTTDPKFTFTIVLPETHILFWKQIVQKFRCTIQHEIVAGGKTRFESVKNGLLKINTEYIAVHDGVRPLVSSNTILRTLEDAKKYGAAIPVVKSVDSVRLVNGNKSKALDRSLLRNVQTPQCFKFEILKDAMNQKYSSSFTDCASVVESAGFNVFLSEGNIENIKITTKFDLKMAESFVNG